MNTRLRKPSVRLPAYFDLYVIRSTGADAADEDTVDHLSESERKVTGLVFALAAISFTRSTRLCRSCFLIRSKR
jgi:hypothetical protein